MNAKRRQQEEQGVEPLEDDGGLLAFTILGLLSLQRATLAQNSMSATF